MRAPWPSLTPPSPSGRGRIGARSRRDFHGKYGDYEITVDILTGIVEGRFPKRALRHVMEWHEIHKNELLEDWDLCRRRENPKEIEPLE